MKEPVHESAERVRRWKSEAAFFDRLASTLHRTTAQPDPAVLERYRAHRQPWFNKEFRFQLLGELAGRSVLDLGCGEGSNALLLAALGARVTGVDVSPGCIDAAREAAHRAGRSGQVQFHCSPLETVELPRAHFDIVWADGIFHHVIPELEVVLTRVLQWARPGALVVFSEPVCRSPWLRALRRHVPIHTDATADERPLTPLEMSLLQRHLPDLHSRPFGCLSRLERLFIPNGQYESASVWRRLAASAMSLIDQAFLSLPGMGRFGGMEVLWGTTPARP